MKSTFLFCSKLRVYWCEIPLLILLGLCMSYNKHATNVFKLYPLYIACILAIIFVVVYFFRVIVISYDEIRYVGWFSSRDRAVINEGKTIIIKMMSKRKMRVTLFGNDGVTPEFDWMKSAQQVPSDIALFRGKAIGGAGAVKRVLRFFGVDKESFDAILKGNGDFSSQYENVTVTASSPDGLREIRIRMDKTV